MSSCVRALLGVVCVFVGSTVGSGVAHAQAGDQEITVAAGPVYAAAPNFRAPSRGVGLATSVFWGFSPSFSVGFIGHFAHHFAIRGGEPDDSNDVLGAFAGAAYNIDVLAVVPYLSLSAGVFGDDGDLRDGQRVAAAIRGAFGLDYRFRRNWSVGAEVTWHGLFPEFTDFPGYSAFWLRASYVFELDAL